MHNAEAQDQRAGQRGIRGAAQTAAVHVLVAATRCMDSLILWHPPAAGEIFLNREEHHHKFCELMSYMIEDVGHRKMGKDEMSFWSNLRQSSMRTMQLLDSAMHNSSKLHAASSFSIARILQSKTDLTQHLLGGLDYEDYCVPTLRVLRHCVERGGMVALEAIEAAECIVECITKSLFNNFATVPETFRDVYNASSQRAYNLDFAKAGLNFLKDLTDISCDGELNPFAWEFDLDAIEKLHHFAQDLHEARKKHALDALEAIQAERYAEHGAGGSAMVLETPEHLLKALLQGIVRVQLHADFEGVDRAAYVSNIFLFHVHSRTTYAVRYVSISQYIIPYHIIYILILIILDR